MKTGQEALRQYIELATAVREVNAGWIVDEVEDEIGRGKSIEFRAVPDPDKATFVRRLSVEAERGVALPKPRATERVGVPYSPEEQLSLLVDATERVVTTTVRAAIFMTEFLGKRKLEAVVFEDTQPLASEDASAATATADARRRHPVLLTPDAEGPLKMFLGRLREAAE